MPGISATAFLPQWYLLGRGCRAAATRGFAQPELAHEMRERVGEARRRQNLRLRARPRPRRPAADEPRKCRGCLGSRRRSAALAAFIRACDNTICMFFNLCLMTKLCLGRSTQDNVGARLDGRDDRAWNTRRDANSSAKMMDLASSKTLARGMPRNAASQNH